jgi:serine/threonine-protein kinase
MSIDDAARHVGRRLAAVLGGADDAPEPPPHGARQGDRLGPYVVLRELGAGGMGTVFLAERADGGFDRKVAVKLLRGFPTADAQARLRRERRILAELDHPAIARLLDGGETEDGQPYLVIEYVEGRPLLEAAAERDRAGRLALWRTIAEAVAHAHQRLVIHRDLKPNNVLVRADGAPKLLDFGIAKLVDAGADTDAVSTRLFTPGYAAPEQRVGGAITTRTDVHALGGLLHELLRAQRPDGAPSGGALWPVPIDRDLAAIIARARADDPAARYATVDALLEDVDAWTEGRAVRARGDNALYAARKLLWRLRVPVAILALAAAATAAFVVELRAARDRALEAEQRARGEQARAERAAQRATSLLTFVTQTFEAASPENTLGRSLSARELIVAAEKRLPEADAKDRGPLALFLAELYAELGERTEAVRLAATATAAAEPPQDAEAGRWLVDAYARAAAHLSPVDAERAVAAAQRAQALQRSYAPRELEAAVTASVAPR